MTKRLPTQGQARKTNVQPPGGSNRCFQSLLFLIAFCSFTWLQPAQAQTPTYFKTGTGTSGNTIPLNQASQKTQLLYEPSDFNILPSSGFISKIYFRNSAAGATATYTDFKVSFLQNTQTSFPSTSFFTGLTLAHQSALESVTANATAGGWFEIPLQAPYFQYDNTQSLIIEIQYTAKTGGISTTTSTSVGNKRVSGQSLTATTGTRNSTHNDFGMDILPVTPCVAPPTAGDAISSATMLCANVDFNLSVTGASFGTGQTFQWETSTTGTGGWTPVGTASMSSSLTTSQTAGTHYYRAAVTCSGQTAYSTPVMVVSPTLISGAFTINAGASASGTNFQTFADALNFISCGINGPVVFDVVAGSGPYLEQVVFTEVPGASATNTVTFNGNGNTVSASPVSATRAIFKLDGADFITLNNFNIETDAAATYGWGVHFQNGADNNTISNNTITIGSTSTTESSSTGIVFSSSNTSVTTTGGDNGNNNVISGNTIIGGYKGLHLNGLPANPGNNQVINNIIKDYHVSGVEVNGVNGTLIEGNTFSRPTRTAVGTFHGVYLSGSNQNTVVSKNIIHNTHGSATSLTGTAYGVYSTSNDTPAGSENIVKNNLIYDFNGTGNIYGFYNSGSDGIYYYNNTVYLENMVTTSIVRGFYQTTSASNIKFINNNVAVISGGAATNQQAIYLNTPASTVESNRNNLYVPNGNTGYYDGTQYLTLADWQTANSGIYDLNSVAADPFFTNISAGNLTPTNALLNNAGQSLAAVTDDITGAPRHATTPDIGAYEFTPSPLDLGVTALITPVAQTCYTNAEPVTVTVNNFGTAAIDFSAITANVTVTVTGAATPTPISVVLTNAFNGGQPLAPTTSMNVVVGTVDMTAAGTYTLNATTNVTAGGTDGNAANNAMPATDVVVDPLAAGTASASNTELCLSGTTTLTLAGNSGGNVQWQSGASVTGPFTDIAGATGSSFTLATPITQTTYYQAVVSCGTSSLASNVITVNVANPIAPTVPAVDRCGAGSVTLTATAAPGATVKWYDVATGGTALGTGTAFTTNVTNTTTFYASTAEGGLSENVGIVNGGTSTYINSSVGWGLHFTANDPVTINSVNVYAVGTGTITIKITDPNDVVLYTAQPVNITAAVASQKLLIPVNLSIPAGTYKMVMSHTGISSLVRESGGVSYPYTSPSGAVTITSGANGTGSASATTSYYWFYDWNISTGCESARTAVIATVNPAPVVNLGADVNVCGVTTTLDAGNAGATFAWSLDGTVITGATSQTLAATTSGTYVVTVTDAGCSATDTIVVNFGTAPATPTITTSGATTFCDGDNVTLTGASTTTGVTYQWLVNGAPINGATSATYNALTAGTYAVIAMVGGCSDTSAVTAVTVNPATGTPTITASNPTTFCAGGSVDLTAVAATTGGRATFQWYLNGTIIPGATSAVNTITLAGSYTVVATSNGCPSAPSAATVVTVNPIPAAPTITLNGNILTSSATSDNYWYLNGNLIAGPTGSTYTPTANGTYTVVVTVNGCDSSPSAPINVTNANITPPTVTAGGPTTFCAGDSVVLTATSTVTGATFTWELNGAAIPGATSATYTATASGSYTAVVNGVSSATSTPITITVNPKPATPTITRGGIGDRDLTSSATTGNQWLMNGTPISGATSQTYTATANGNYAVVVTDNGCSSDTSAIVNITNTGINGALAGMSVSVYPNPNNGHFNVKLVGYNQDAALELYNLTGQLIVKETAKAGKQITPMQVKNLAAGTYLLKVISEKGVQISKLIVE